MIKNFKYFYLLLGGDRFGRDSRGGGFRGDRNGGGGGGGRTLEC